MAERCFTRRASCRGWCVRAPASEERRRVARAVDVTSGSAAAGFSSRTAWERVCSPRDWTPMEFGWSCAVSGDSALTRVRMERMRRVQRRAVSAPESSAL